MRILQISRLATERVVMVLKNVGVHSFFCSKVWIRGRIPEQRAFGSCVLVSVFYLQKRGPGVGWRSRRDQENKTYVDAPLRLLGGLLCLSVWSESTAEVQQVFSCQGMNFTPLESGLLSSKSPKCFFLLHSPSDFASLNVPPLPPTLHNRSHWDIAHLPGML